MYQEMDAFLRRDAEKRLRTLSKSARRSGVRARTLLSRGVPHEAIRRAARKARADLVVVGTHGRTGLSRLVVGSVAARVLATAPCPVLTVRSR
jgi:universal stress protein A